jgi:hypothetical protein
MQDTNPEDEDICTWSEKEKRKMLVLKSKN